MSVYPDKRSPYWQYDFQFKGRRYYGSTGCTSRREAEKYERRMRHEAANPSAARPAITIDEAAGLYAEHAERQTSWATTRYMLAAMIAGLGKNKLLSEVSQRDLQIYFYSRRSSRSNATINREIDLARAVWRRAMKTRYDVGDMPDWRALYLHVPKIEARELAQGAEQAALLAALDPDALAVVRFALLSGWRRAEVIGLRWSDCDLAARTARTRIKGGDTVVRPLSPSLVALIANCPKATPFVFTYECRQSRAKRRKGQRYAMTVTALRARWDEARERAGLKDFRFHDLRHTAASRILRATGNLALTQKALAHSRIETTLRYAHVLDQDLRDGLAAAEGPAPAVTRKRKIQ